MNPEKAEKYLRHLLASLKRSAEQWCAEEVDDAEEMWQEYPPFIHENINAIEEVLEFPRTNLRILSAVYGAEQDRQNVMPLIEKQLNFNNLKIYVDNYSMKGDPAPGCVKALHLRYSLNGQENDVTIPEGRGLHINRDGCAIT